LLLTMVSKKRSFPAAAVTDLSSMRRYLEETAAAMDVPDEDLGDMVLAVNEAVSNILRHGYRGRPGNVEMQVSRDDSALVVILRDEAPLYDPTQRPVPDTSVPLARRQFGGMGVHMMREFVDKLHYRVSAQGRNELELVKMLVH